jgi:hypothetical protein
MIGVAAPPIAVDAADDRTEIGDGKSPVLMIRR